MSSDQVRERKLELGLGSAIGNISYSRQQPSSSLKLSLVVPIPQSCAPPKPHFTKENHNPEREGPQGIAESLMRAGSMAALHLCDSGARDVSGAPG